MSAQAPTPMNPLFPDEPAAANAHHQAGYVLPQHRKAHAAQPAVELIRRKIDALYATEPDVRQELAESQTVPVRSRHQQFMHELSTSGKSLAAIQAAWHDYYANLPDDEKRRVWQEFYAANNGAGSAYSKYIQQRSAAPAVPAQPTAQPATVPLPAAAQPPAETQPVIVVPHHQPAPPPPGDERSFAAIKKQVLRKVRRRTAAHTRAKEHLQSLAFGLGSGALVLVVVLFSFFNEVIIAPFIRPGSHAGATPIILSTDGVAPSDKQTVIIPAINVELPYVTGSSVQESDIQTQLEEGVVHYPTTASPGQQGNVAIFGHSSNNIFNKGKYKFAFVLLHELKPGDIFYLTHTGKVYTYKVFQKKVVEPTETWVLNPVEGKTATAALITCDPPGTSLRRLVVWGEQVNPAPDGNTAAPPPVAASAPQELPSNSPTLWSRAYHWVAFWD